MMDPFDAFLVIWGSDNQNHISNPLRQYETSYDRPLNETTYLKYADAYKPDQRILYSPRLEKTRKKTHKCFCW